MRCSVRGKDDHNSRGHEKYMQREQVEQQDEEEEDEFACEAILHVIGHFALQTEP